MQPTNYIGVVRISINNMTELEKQKHIASVVRQQRDTNAQLAQDKMIELAVANQTIVELRAANAELEKRIPKDASPGAAEPSNP